MYGVFLILVLVLTGGAIAFIGDRLGTKIGKKRLSLFGLRPRHTSILVTIVTGFCITAVTFGIMAAVSENVRTALFGMEQLNANMRSAEARLEQATDDLASANAQKEQAASELAESQKNVDALKEQQASLVAESERLQEGNRLLEAAKGELLARNDLLQRQNAELLSQNDGLAAENKALDANNDALTAMNAELETRTKELREGLITIREGDIAFRAGEVIASGVIRGNRPAEEVKNDMEALAQLAGRNVSSRLGTNVSDDAIWIYQPEYEAAVETIHKSQKDMVVRIVAAGNLVRGEAVRTSLQLYPNSIIYKDKEFIIAKPVKAAGTSGNAEESVMRFLKEVNGAATAKGILPDPIRGSVGVMEGAQFYDVVHQLSLIHGPAILSAYANGSTDALGPLRLTIRVESSEEAK